MQLVSAKRFAKCQPIKAMGNIVPNAAGNTDMPIAAHVDARR
jgi:hypothetical protein